MSNHLKEHLSQKIPILDDATYYIPSNASTIDEYKRALVYEEATPSKEKTTLIKEKEIILNDDEKNNELITHQDTKENIFFHSISSDDEDDKSTSSTSSVIIEDITIENKEEKEKSNLFVECTLVDLNDELIPLELEEDTSSDEETITIENISNDESIKEISSNLSALFEGDVSIDDIDFTDDMMSVIDSNNNKNQGALDEDMSFVNKIKDANDITDEDDFVDLMGKINLSNFKKDKKEDELL